MSIQSSEPAATGGQAGPSSTPVVFVGGSGRSGSTLIGRVLGQLPGWVCVGELVFLWTRGLQEDELCSCGVPFSSCPFWSAVGIRAFGGWSHVDAGAIADLRLSVDRNRYLPRMIGGTGGRRYDSRLRRYGEIMSQVYRAVCEVSGAAVVVDTSKHPSYAYVLRRIGTIETRLLHLVRDSRGVSHSWTRQVTRPEVRSGDDRLMPRYSPLHSASEWMLYNGLLELLGRLGVPGTVLRYEDFVQRPVEVLAEVAEALSGQTTEIPPSLVTEEGVLMTGDHSLAGNPMRFRDGRIALRLDDEWRTAMSGAARRTVTVITSPGLVRYRYLARRRGRGVHLPAA